MTIRRREFTTVGVAPLASRTFLSSSDDLRSYAACLWPAVSQDPNTTGRGSRVCANTNVLGYAGR